MAWPVPELADGAVAGVLRLPDELPEVPVPVPEPEVFEADELPDVGPDEFARELPEVVPPAFWAAETEALAAPGRL